MWKNLGVTSCGGVELRSFEMERQKSWRSEIESTGQLQLFVAASTGTVLVAVGVCNMFRKILLD